MNDNLKWLATIRYLKEDIVHDTCEEGKARLEKAILLVESVGLDTRNIDLALESVKCVSHFPPLNATAKSMFPSEADILAYAREICPYYLDEVVSMLELLKSLKKLKSVPLDFPTSYTRKGFPLPVEIPSSKI